MVKQSSKQTNSPITRMGDLFVSHHNCLPHEIQEGINIQKELIAEGSYRPIGKILVELGYLSDNAVKQALDQQCLQVMSRSEIFSSISERVISKLAREASIRNYPAGTLIMRQNEIGNTFYLMVSGIVRAYRVSESGIEISLAEFGPCQGFGEISVLSKRPRTAFVQTTQASCLMEFSEENFHRLCMEFPQISMALNRVLCERLITGNLSLDRVSNKELAVRQLFGKYVAPEVRDKILSGQISLDGDVRNVTLLFADLRDFTPLVEITPPKVMVSILNAYFTEMTHAIRSEKGVVLQYIGDEIEAVFGAPLDLSDHQDRAVRAALKMKKRLKTLNTQLRKVGMSDLRHGIGIHTGRVVAANIGSSDRMSYSLVGDTVNIASRIQDANKRLKTDILISDDTQKGLQKKYNIKNLPPVSLKGVGRAVSLKAIL